MKLLEGEDDDLSNYLLSFQPEDRELCDKLADGVRAMLTRSDLRPLQIASMARLLLGLSRLPLTTPGVDVFVTLHTGTPDDSYAYEIGIKEDQLWLGGGGYIRGPFGGDSYGGWVFEVEEAFHSDPDDAELEWLDEFPDIALNYDIEIQDDSDESQLDWENDDGSAFWSFIESADDLDEEEDWEP